MRGIDEVEVVDEKITTMKFKNYLDNLNLINKSYPEMQLPRLGRWAVVFMTTCALSS